MASNAIEVASDMAYENWLLAWERTGSEIRTGIAVYGIPAPCNEYRRLAERIILSFDRMTWVVSQ